LKALIISGTAASIVQSRLRAAFWGGTATCGLDFSICIGSRYLSKSLSFLLFSSFFQLEKTRFLPRTTDIVHEPKFEAINGFNALTVSLATSKITKYWMILWYTVS
jgi:hypothetical protein